MELNTIGIAGTVAVAPEPHHNVYGQEKIYSLWLDIARDSGTIDRILVLFQEDKIEGDSFGALLGDYFDAGTVAEMIKKGSRLEVTGQLQTYKERETGRSQLFVWSTYLAILPEDIKQINAVYIRGEVVKPPVYRETPKGKYITDLELRVASAFSPGFTCVIPCITWGRNAEYTAYLEPGTPVYLEGRLQSREYMKHDQILTTWEVSASKVDTKE